jgi:hypothetical protein
VGFQQGFLLVTCQNETFIKDMSAIYKSLIINKEPFDVSMLISENPFSPSSGSVGFSWMLPVHISSPFSFAVNFEPQFLTATFCHT